jgi:Arc/MetJ-type ribon-helix-helix transcriptional regulator
LLWVRCFRAFNRFRPVRPVAQERGIDFKHSDERDHPSLTVGARIGAGKSSSYPTTGSVERASPPKRRRSTPGERLDSGRMNCHTGRMVQKVAVTLEKKTVADLDRWVREGRYPNRSRALQRAVDLLEEREKRSGLARELAKLNPAEERAMAEEGLGDDSWPAF